MFAEAAKSHWEKLVTGEPVCVEVPAWKDQKFDGKLYIKPESASDRMKYIHLMGNPAKRAEAYARVIVNRSYRYDSDGDLILFYRTPEDQSAAVKALCESVDFETLSEVSGKILDAFSGDEAELGKS